MPKFENIKVVLFDIAGTLSPLSFVEVNELIPYVKNNLKNYLENNYQEKEVQNVIKAIYAELNCNYEDELEKYDKSELVRKMYNNIMRLMVENGKSTPLKHLQGLMYGAAFHSKSLIGKIFPDVAPFMKYVVNSGRKIAIYSTGSILAQKLLFSHTVDGDLTHLINDYFDTTIGVKTEKISYENIAKHFDVECDKILFFTDLPIEALAATDAGCHAVLTIREGNLLVDKNDLEKLPFVHSLNDISFQ